MSQSSINPAIILNELSSGGVKLLMDQLGVFLEFLETKNDPEPVEMKVVDAAYQAIEKFQLLEAAMREYQTEESEDLIGSKLDQLYSADSIDVGTTKLFKV
jgi:hypothetical protein